MNAPLRTLALVGALTALALSGGCSDPPPVSSTTSGTANPGTTDPGDTPDTPDTGELIAGIGYNPKYDPLVNPDTLLQVYDASEATEDDYLCVTLNGNPRTLNPIMGSSTYEFMLNGFLYEGPFSFDRNMKWMVNPAFTESLEISEDRKIWRVTLKPGLKWHDGHPLTAHDIEFSYKMIMSPHVVTPQRSGTDELETVRAIDDLTVEYVDKKPLPTSKWNILFSILPKHIYEKDLEANPDLKSGEYYSRVNREGIGAGPYRIVEWVEDDKVVLERWEDYPGPKPHFKRLICRIIPDTNMQLVNFEKGVVDETRLSSKQFADETVGSETFKKVGFKALGTQWAFSYISWNMRGNAFFGDTRVRRAMTHACNIPLMIDKLEYNLSTTCYGIFHPDAWMFNDEVKKLHIGFDLDKAAALLDEAGWAVSDEDGWRSKGGEKFSFTLLIPQGASISREIAAVFQQDLKSIGVEMETQIIEWATYQEKTRKHDFQASIAAWGTGTDPDTNWNLWHSEMIDQEGGRNYSCFANDRVDELFALAREEFDEKKRAAYYGEIQKIIYEEQPYTFLWNRAVTWAFNNRIRGVTFSPRGVWNFDPSYLGWWVHRGEQAHGMK